jgi:hypothetical protein
VKLTEAPNSDSEEPKSTDSIDIIKGKPRCIIPFIFKLCNLFTCVFKLLELNENLRCIILGTYFLNTRNRVRLDAMLIGPVKVE